MADSIEFKRGDTVPLTATLYADDAKTTPLDLTNATTVSFIMASAPAEPGTPKVNAACTVIDALNGRVRYAWAAADTDTAGSYSAEFEVTWNDGTVQTVPRQGYLTVTITEDLD